MSTNEITAKVRELRELQALIEEASAEAEAIKDALKAQMGAQEELKAGEYKITYRPVESTRLDTAALKEACPTTYNRFARKSTTRRFMVA